MSEDAGVVFRVTCNYSARAWNTGPPYLQAMAAAGLMTESPEHEECQLSGHGAPEGLDTPPPCPQ